MRSKTQKSKKKTGAYDAAVRLLARFPKTSFQVREYLKKKGYSFSEINTALEELESRGLVCDRKYAVLWLESRLNRNPIGPVRAIFELKRKGISSDDVEQVVEEMYERFPEEDLVKKVLAKKFSSCKAMPEEIKLRKIKNFLQQRGFTRDIIFRAIKNE